MKSDIIDYVTTNDIAAGAYADAMADDLLVIFKRGVTKAVSEERKRIREELTQGLQESDSWWWLDQLIDRICPE